MEMGHILCNEKAGKGFACGSVGVIGGNSANDLHSVSFMSEENGASAYSVDRNTVNQVGVSELLTGADVSREKTERTGLNVGEAKPANFDPYADGRAHWKECYGELWKLKIAFEKENYCRICRKVDKNNSLV